MKKQRFLRNRKKKMLLELAACYPLRIVDGEIVSDKYHRIYAPPKIPCRSTEKILEALSDESKWRCVGVVTPYGSIITMDWDEILPDGNIIPPRITTKGTVETAPSL